MWRQYKCSYPANGSTNPDVFQPKTFSIPRGIIPQISARWGCRFGGVGEQTYKQTDRLTDILLLSQSDKSLIESINPGLKQFMQALSFVVFNQKQNRLQKRGTDESFNTLLCQGPTLLILKCTSGFCKEYILIEKEKDREDIAS